MRILIWGLIGLITLLCNGCTKKADEGPVEYFNCYINGQYWTYKQPTGITSHDALKAQAEKFNIPHYNLGADNVEDVPYTGFGFYIDNDSFPSRDTFDLTILGAGANALLIFPSDSAHLDDSYGYVTNLTNKGKLIFTKRSSTLLQGIFYFDAYEHNFSKSVHVTNGQFSIVPQ